MKLSFYFLMLLLAAGCRQRYNSPVHSPVTGYLVIDGVVNSMGASSISLTRTTKFDNKNIFHEEKALVTLQGEDSAVYAFTEKEPGQYNIDNLNLSSSIKYRLQIKTKDNRQYVSDFTEVKNNPAIDSISWKLNNAGVQLSIHTHDPMNNARYYQWYYDEVWEYHSPYLSFLKYYVVRDPNKGIQYHVGFSDSSGFTYNHDIVTCWQGYAPTSLFISSTAKLSADIIDLPLTFIPRTSVRLAILYSIHVRQYTWTKDGYAFLEKIRRNTESTGTIFDPQPAELKGNIHCVTDDKEPVIGYFNICPLQEKRIFIKNSEVPGWNYSPNCPLVIVENKNDVIVKDGLDLMPTITESTNASGDILKFWAADRQCVDCTVTGTNIKPAYWP